ncbi:MAG: hypothetical protein KJ630_14665 [Proteobacteria bacterium]|nr:hypothetical protein [Pseudomonadota bacterium]
MSIITTQLLSKIREHYSLNWYGTHGIYHWSRVYDNGVRLAEQKGVNSSVVQLFSVLHDSKRLNEHLDPKHGPRAAKLILSLREYLPLDYEELELLTIACSLHTSARTHQDITIAACFDSDRLDLVRIGAIPDPNYLCTPMAKLPETIAWALKKNMDNHLPENAFGIVDYKENID